MSTEKTTRLSLSLKILHLKRGRYRSPTQLAAEINRLYRKEGLQEKVRLDYDRNSRLVSRVVGERIGLRYFVHR